MKTNSGYRIKLYEGKKSTRDFFRKNSEYSEWSKNGAKGKFRRSTKFRASNDGHIIWHFDVTVEGKGNRVKKNDLALIEELAIASEMEE